MTPRSLREIDYFAVAQAFTMEGFVVHQTLDKDSEIHRWEYADFKTDLHVWVFPLKGEVLVIEGLADGADPDEQSFR